MPVRSASGKECGCVVVDNNTRTRPLRLKSEAVDAFKSFRVVEESELG
jgi:hypothetical protein